MYLLKKKILSFVIPFMTLAILPSASTQAAEKYSDETLEKFAKAVIEVLTIQQESQFAMMELIEKHEMSVERFNELMMQIENRQPIENPPTEKELEQYAKITEDLQEFQEGLQNRLIEAIEEHDMDVEEYEAIIQDYQNDPELKKRIDNLLE